ncbi:Protein kinase protein rad53 [Clarireedia jacksonii]
MEEPEEEKATQPTQPLTQLVVDPRRLGKSSSGMNAEDMSDIVCILHPDSATACEAAYLIKKNNPRCTMDPEGSLRAQDGDVMHAAEDATTESNEPGTTDYTDSQKRAAQRLDLPSQLPTSKATPDNTSKETTQPITNLQDGKKVKIRGEAASAPRMPERDLPKFDLAVRLSANLKEPDRGWVFGRNMSRCDFILEDEQRRVSNTHFRIYINEYGTIMLEDTSTNGTSIDGTVIKAKAKAKEKQHDLNYQHTLENGSVISLIMEPRSMDFRFIVRIPQRTDEAQATYEANLAGYMNRAKDAEHKRALVAGGNKQPPDLFAKPPVAPLTLPPAPVGGRRAREWKGGAKYNKIDMIGRGAFAVVYKLTDKYSGIPYAAKELEKKRFMKNGAYDQKVETEMRIMSKIDHQNVVKFIEYVDWDQYLYLIMEYVPGGDLTGFVTKHRNLPEPDVKIMAVQLLDAVKYLHGMGISHRDVKPDNILIQSENPLHVKLTDFGLSKMIENEGDTFLSTFCGTLLYCAPEVYAEYRSYGPNGETAQGYNSIALWPQRYDHTVDVWSLACVLFYSLCGSPPYPANNGMTYQALLHTIMTTPLDIRPLQRLKEPVSDDGIRFVRKMLHINPTYRATIPELEQSPWITGKRTEPPLSQSFDEIGDDTSDSLGEVTDRLSLVDDQENRASLNESEMTEIQLQHHEHQASQYQEIPSSFDTTGSSNGDFGAQENYEFLRTPKNNARLFGEVNMNSSALGSSGVVPLDHVNLPVPVQHLENPISQEGAIHDYRHPVTDSFADSDISEQLHAQITETAYTTKLKGLSTMPPSSHTVTTATKNARLEPLNDTSSLMGAESHLGHLRMDSPSMSESQTSPNTQYYPRSGIDPGVSLRRRREDSNDTSSWWPVDLPPQKRLKSGRAIDMVAPPDIFWDPRDKSTHHTNYPRMTVTALNHFQELAKAKGEVFAHGNKTFEQTMQSFRSSRSPSAEPAAFARAQSDPLVEDGRRHLLKRDERRLSMDASVESSNKNISPSLSASKSGSTVEIEPGITMKASEMTSFTDAVSQSPLCPVPETCNDFQTPKRVLAKFIATADSVLPTIVNSITEPFTSYGRSYENTLRYANGKEDRMPKKAFKLLLFKPGFYKAGQKNRVPWSKDNSGPDDDFAFYISSKASSGIYVNGIHLPSHDTQNQFTESKYWVELRNGDIITIWQKDGGKGGFLNVRFECFWGKSKLLRKKGEEIKSLEGPLLGEVELSCIQLEKAAQDERKRQHEEESRHAKELKQKKNHQNQIVSATA